MKAGLLLTIAFFAGFTSSAASRAEEPEASSSEVDEVRLENLVIDEIDLEGVTVFTQGDLEKAMELAPGDRLERKKIVGTAKALQEIYRRHGYEQVRVQTRLNQKSQVRGAPLENVLEISISEGSPTRLGSLQIEVSDPRWQKRLNSLATRLGLVPGDVFDEEKLANGFRAYQDAIAAYDFMGVKVTQESVITVAPKPGAFSPSVLGQTARWVELRLHVELGERVSFGFRGNQLLTAIQLSTLVDEQRLLGFSQDYQERIRVSIEEEYRKNGYDLVKVETFTFESEDHSRRHVTYQITEGSRVKIGEIRFDGNVVFAEPDLIDMFLEKGSPLMQRGYYVEKEVRHTADLVVEWMKSQGYLTAKLISVSHSVAPKSGSADLLIYIYEGEQTTVQNVVMKNVTVFTPEEVKVALKNRESLPLNLYDFSEGLERLKAMYRNRGYLDFKIRNEGTSDLVNYSDDNRTADIMLDVDEGPRFIVTRIDITGLKKTERRIVEREYLLAPGDILREDLWIATESRIRRLGIFGTATIKIHPDPTRQDGKILQVIVEEGNPGLIAGGFGVRNDIGGRVFGQVSYSNLWGRNHTVSLSGNANRRFGRFGAEFCPSNDERALAPNTDHCFIEFNAELAYTFPWAIWGETSFRPQISYSRTQYRILDANRTAVDLVLQRPLLTSPNLQGVLTYSLEKVKQYHANDPADDLRLTIGSITPSLILDMRDSALAPTKGIYSTATFEFASPDLGSQRKPRSVSYTRSQYRLDGYVPLPRDIGVFLSFRTGLAYNLAPPPKELSKDDPSYKSYAIPVIKQFALGGTGSLRGFREQTVNLGDTAVVGYMSYVNYRAQIDLPFAGPLRFGPFVDAANLLADNYSLGKSMLFGIGAGLHYRSPVGPVNFDIGVNPHPRSPKAETKFGGDDEYVLHFSIGTI